MLLNKNNKKTSKACNQMKTKRESNFYTIDKKKSKTNVFFFFDENFRLTDDDVVVPFEMTLTAIGVDEMLDKVRLKKEKTTKIFSRKKNQKKRTSTHSERLSRVNPK